jgi:hypothetical protein
MLKSRRMDKECSMHEREVHAMLVGKPEGERPLGRLLSKWENNIKIDLKEIRMG